MAKSPERLLGAFLDIIERIFPADQVPLEEGNRFVIDPSVENLSALVFHGPDDEPVTLVAPDGTRYTADTAPDDIRWQVEPHFDLIRVPDPEAGEWRLEGPVGAKSRISVTSPWRLRTSGLPTTLYRGFPVSVEAWLEHDEVGTPLPDDLRFSVALEGDDGETLASVRLDAGDEGRFQGQLPAPTQTGNARLMLRAQGEGFERQREQAANVLPAIGVAHDPGNHQLVLAAEHPRLNRGNTEIHGDFQERRLQAEAVSETRWRLSLPELEDDTSQPLRLVATVTLDGETRELMLPTVTLNADSQVGIGRPDMAGPTLTAERFAEADEPSASQPDENIADRFVEWVNAVPDRLHDAWQAGWPGVERAVEKHGKEPRLWIAIGALLLWLLSVGWWHRRRRSRTKARRSHMCELLGMSANVPTDICFSFSGFLHRGGGTGPHRDGWGIAFYEAGGYRDFRDPHPSVDSPIARLICDYPIKSHVVISTSARPMSGKCGWPTPIPLPGKCGGAMVLCSQWSAQPRMVESASVVLSAGGDYRQRTCLLLVDGRTASGLSRPPDDPEALWQYLHRLCEHLRTYGVFNLLLADGEHLYTYCSTKLAHITRRAPFGRASLSDAELAVNFAEHTTPDDVVSVIATEPLTDNENWVRMMPGELLVWRDGDIQGAIIREFQSTVLLQCPAGIG